MKLRSFTKVRPWGHDGETCWLSEIYKIVSYREGEFFAFYLHPNDMNWGRYVSVPPERSTCGHRCWLTIRSAMRACDKHAKQNNSPTQHQISRARLTLAALVEQEATHHD